MPIGDGQYVELPEGYSLIQTDEGYIIGQPGSTFTQVEWINQLGTDNLCNQLI